MRNLVALVLLFLANSVVRTLGADADGSFGEQRSLYDGPYQDSVYADPFEEDEPGYPEVDAFPFFRKRSYPRWYQGFVYKSPSFQSLPVIQSKRFLPFHPLARFRGLSMSGGSGGGIVPYGGAHRGYATYVSDSSSVPSPGHPVPSGDIKEAGVGTGGLGPQVEPKEKINAGDILRMLGSAGPSNDRGSVGSQAKIFRFGIRK